MASMSTMHAMSSSTSAWVGGVTLTAGDVGALFRIGTMLDSTGPPRSMLSQGVSSHWTVWSRLNQLPSSVFVVIPGSRAPSRSQAYW